MPTNPRFDLAGRTVIVTGGGYLAARSSGRAIDRLPSSPASDFMTGQTLLVDGGKMMH